MKIVAIVQARMGSTRLPEKVMLDITGYSMIEILLKSFSISTYFKNNQINHDVHIYISAMRNY